MVVTLSWTLIASVAGVIIAIGSAWKVIMEARNALNKPHKNLEAKIDHCNEHLANHEERVDELELSLHTLGKDNEIELMALRDIINHLRTNNNTGDMEKIEDGIEKYLIKRINITQP